MISDDELNSTDIICVLKDHYGAYAYVNKAMADRFNEPAPGFMGKSDYHFMADEDAVRIRKNDKEVLNTLTELNAKEFIASKPWQVLKFPICLDDIKFLGAMALPLYETEGDVETAVRKAQQRFRKEGPSLRKRLEAVAQQMVEAASGLSSAKD